MPSPGILITGRSIAGDKPLVQAISQIAEVVTRVRPSDVEQALQRYPTVRLLLLEIDSADFDTGLLRRLRQDFPDVQIILIDGSGNRDLLAKAFSVGVKDAFPEPLNRELLVERAAALFRGA